MNAHLGGTAVQPMQARRHIDRNLFKRVMFARADGISTNMLVWFGAALLLASSIIHLHLWDIAYQHVATLGPLFLVQGIGGIALAIALAVFRRRVFVLGALALVAGTIVGFILVLNTGLFGFKLDFISTEAAIALGIECTAVVVLTTAALRIHAD